MNWFNKMERKFGKYAIKNLSLYIVICYGFGFLMNAFKPDWVYLVTLNPHAILHGANPNHCAIPHGRPDEWPCAFRVRA